MVAGTNKGSGDGNVSISSSVPRPFCSFSTRVEATLFLACFLMGGWVSWSLLEVRMVCVSETGDGRFLFFNHGASQALLCYKFAQTLYEMTKLHTAPPLIKKSNFNEFIQKRSPFNRKVRQFKFKLPHNFQRTKRQSFA